ncbi:sialic acid-binding Ig-like lectin 14 [Dromiciops gliroides]|uniref:sialic acid-binding Ig-like lectin 14 n=1 Tax=Dromiciops gliroides TaxID=33562 RepID=UPI001CC61740|nr:sialic acid-binding Ig-like lectin 14 [Dromiciops gliroides]
MDLLLLLLPSLLWRGLSSGLSRAQDLIMDLLLLLLLLPLLWRGTISQNTDYAIHVQQTVTVQEGLCVSIPCSFYYPQHNTNYEIVHGYWYYSGSFKYHLVATNDPQASVHSWAQGRFHLIGDPQMGNCSLRLTRAQKNDQGSYGFWMKKKNLDYGYTKKMVSIQVHDLTQKPEVHIPEILESGHQVNLTCTVPGACREGTSITFLWTGTALSPSRLASQDLHSSQLLFTPQPQDHDTSLTCQVKFKEPSVSTRTTVQLRVFSHIHPSIADPPWNMKISISWANGIDPVFPANTSSLVVLEGESLTLICYTQSKPPAALSWAHGNQILNSTQASDPGVLHLELSKLRSHNSGEYTCQARNSLGNQHYTVRLCVQTLTQKPEVHIPEILESGHQVTLTCLVPGTCREGKHFTYLWSGAALSPKGSALLNTSKLLFTPQPQDHGTNITCQVTFPKARVSTERTVQLTVTYPPQNVTISVSWANRTGPELLGNTSTLQMLEGESLTLVCATKSNPPATLIWSYKNQVLRSSEASDSGVLHLALSKLRPKDRGKYTCQAQHPLGHQQHSMSLCVQTCSCCPISEDDGSWPLIFTLLRGAVMAASFLLTYGLTWLHYTCQVN